MFPIPLILAALTQSPGLDFVTYGPHHVGFRHSVHLDASRSEGPATDWSGRATQHQPRLRMNISVWYPANAAGRRMTAGDYATLYQTGGQAAQTVMSMGRFWLGRPLTADEATAFLARTLVATRDAAPLTGRFPVVVGNLGHATAAPLAEFLASHGFVVVSTNPTGTASMQVTQPQAALEAHTRWLETLVGLARDLPFADTTRLAVAGFNFDGMAALLYQMRNMRASAVVSIDGWEGKPNGFAMVTANPWFDERRMRVPWLAFMQADAPRPELGADSAILARMRFSPRAMYVLPGLGHTHLIGGIAPSPLLGDTARTSFGTLYETVRGFLDRHVRRPSPAAVPMELAGRATPVMRAARPALPPVPDAAEFEALVMSGDTTRLLAVIRQAREADSTVSLFDRQTMNLFAFRFRERPEIQRVLMRLAQQE